MGPKLVYPSKIDFAIGGDTCDRVTDRSILGRDSVYLLRVLFSTFPHKNVQTVS